MKLLLMVMAVGEGVAGVGLLVMPAMTASMLIGASLDTPGALFAGRLAGAAILALAIACWQARNSARDGAATGIVAAMLFYNQATAFLLVYASIRLELQSTLIWPVFVLHQMLAGWCIATLSAIRRKLAKAVVSEE